MKNFSLTAIILILVHASGFVMGQCNLNALQSTGYMTGQCNGYFFQSSIGSISRVSGSCGSLFFTPPLTGSDFVNNTIHPDKGNVVIIPNPALDFLLIQGLAFQDQTSVEIYTSTGQIALKKQLAQENTPLFISELRPGMYYLKLYRHDKQTFIHKFIKI